MNVTIGADATLALPHVDRLLVIWPPQVPSYFNAGHHLGVFLTSAYARANGVAGCVDALDAGALNLSWKEVADVLYQGQYDVIAMMNDFDAVDGFARFIRYARELCPSARIVTFGRLSGMAPQAFMNDLDLDGVVCSGDYESGVASFAAAVANGHSPVAGVAVRRDGEWVEAGGPGRWLPAEEWVLPDPAEIPYEAYDRVYHRDQNKFCGIPDRRELIVPTARGCPVGCSFCEVPTLAGLRERRLSVDATVGYIERCFAAGPFEYVSFYAPTFTLDRGWMVDLCNRLIDRGLKTPWKCATTMHHLDADLVALMGRSGCIRISVGLETLDEAGLDALPRLKRKGVDGHEALSSWCTSAGIELNCFVIVGLPGTTPAGTARTIERIREHEGRVRPTAFSPLDVLSTATSLAEATAFNRHFLPATMGLGAHDFYEFIFGSEEWVTPVARHIPRADSQR